MWHQGALLFYSLIIGNPIFLDTTLARGDVELLFLPLLQQMYHIDNIRSDRQLYVLVIVLLILTQDAPFNMGASSGERSPITYLVPRVHCL